MKDLIELAQQIKTALISLNVCFIVLKTFHLIDITWLWVFSPVWIPGILWLVICGLAYTLKKIAKNGEEI